MSTSAALPIGSVAIPEAVHTIPPTSREAMDAAVNAIAAQKDKWVGLSIAERVKLLDVLMDRTLSEAERWAAAGLKAKGISPSSPTAGEEWLAGPAVMARNIRLLKRSLLEIERFGAPQLPAEPYARADGRVVATVFPTDNWDKLTFTGFSAEVWMEPEVTLANLPDHMAEFYRTRPTTGKVALVLGAGNVSSIGPMDALYKLFVEGQVVILKMNPVNENLGPVFADIFQPLADRGFFRLVYGGAAEGDYLCNHEGVEEIHITGSDKTYDAIVWGVGADGELPETETGGRSFEAVIAFQVPIVLRLSFISRVFDMEVDLTSRLRDGDLQTPGIRFALSYGLSAPRTSSLMPYVLAWVGYEIVPGGRNDPASHIIWLGTKVGFDWDP